MATHRQLRDDRQRKADRKFLRGVGRLFRRWRTLRGMTKQELALSAMLSPRQYENIESRTRREPPDIKLTTFVLLLSSLDVTFAEFFHPPWPRAKQRRSPTGCSQNG